MHTITICLYIPILCTNLNTRSAVIFFMDKIFLNPHLFVCIPFVDFSFLIYPDVRQHKLLPNECFVLIIDRACACRL